MNEYKIVNEQNKFDSGNQSTHEFKQAEISDEIVPWFSKNTQLNISTWKIKKRQGYIVLPKAPTRAAAMNSTLTSSENAAFIQEKILVTVGRETSNNDNELPAARQIRPSVKWVLKLPKPLKTVYCKICCENVLDLEGRTFTGEECCHRFCRSCLGSYLSAASQDVDTVQYCPFVGRDGCSNFVTDEDFQCLCKLNNTLKPRSFSCTIEEKPSSETRKCPLCGHKQQGSRKKPAMVCAMCNYSFCFFHSNQHESLSCEKYLEILQQTRQREMIKQNKPTKQCPDCRALAQKSKGCNHMLCSECCISWCWLCEKNIQEDPLKHYQLWNFWGCPGAQFQEDKVADFLLFYRAYVVLAVFSIRLLQCFFFPLFLVLFPLFVMCENIRSRNKTFSTDLAAASIIAACGVVLVFSLVVAIGIVLLNVLAIPFIFLVLVVLRRSNYLPCTVPLGTRLYEHMIVPFQIITYFARQLFVDSHF